MVISRAKQRLTMQCNPRARVPFSPAMGTGPLCKRDLSCSGIVFCERGTTDVGLVREVSDQVVGCVRRAANNEGAEMVHPQQQHSVGVGAAGGPGHHLSS